MLLSEGNPPEIQRLGAAVRINESKLIIGTMANLDSVKAVYNNLYSTVAESWTKSLVYCPMIKLDATIDDTNRNGWAGIKFRNNYKSNELIKSYDFFFYINGCFPQMKN